MTGRWAVAAGSLALLLAGCGGDREPPAAEPEARAVLPDSVLIERGGGAATRLATGLVAPLTQAIEEHGTAGAIDFCSREAQRLTAAVADSIGRDIAIGRTTLKPRNPANAPDSLDRLVLGELHALAAAGDSLPPYRLVEDGEQVRYYRPLRIQPLCVQCHGPVDQLEPEVLRLLQQRYPGDQATGYREGDLRGAIRVVMPRAAVH